MSKTQAINNTNVFFTILLLCRTDKTSCLIRCPKCEIEKACRHTRAFKCPESVWNHLTQKHANEANLFPSKELSIQLLEEISQSLKDGTDLNELEQQNKLGMIVN